MYNISRIFIRRKVLKIQHLSTVVNKVEDQIKPWSEIPGPLSLPIVGQMLHFLPGGWLHQRTIELQELLYKHYGPIVRLEGNLGFPPLTFIFDPDAAINLFRKEEPLPVRPGFDSLVYHRNHYYKEHIDDPTGSILDHGEPWKKVRSLANPIMLQPKTVKLYSNTMAEVADDMVKRMRSKRNKQDMLESSLLTELNLWALESVAVVALGARLNCLDPNLPDDSPAKKLVLTMHDFFEATEKLDFQPSLWKYIATPAFTKGMKVYSEQLRLNEFFINKAVEQLKSNKNEENDENKSILERLLEIDRKIAIVMTNDMLLAGIDTMPMPRWNFLNSVLMLRSLELAFTLISATLGLLFLLATHPDKQNKLREEVRSKEEKRTNIYLRACIKESMRLLAVLGGNFRQTTKEHDILGYRIPAKMNILIGNQHMCLMEEQFPRATEFLPERWIVDKSDPLYYGNAHPFAFTPFGFGVRRCLGRRIAALQMETFITKMISNFKLDWTGPPPKRARVGVVNYFVGPYYFVFKDV